MPTTARALRSTEADAVVGFLAAYIVFRVEPVLPVLLQGLWCRSGVTRGGTGGTDDAAGSTGSPSRFPLDPAESPAVPPVTPYPLPKWYSKITLCPTLRWVRRFGEREADLVKLGLHERHIPRSAAALDALTGVHVRRERG